MAEPGRLTIRRSFPRPGDEERAPFADVPSGWVVDALGRRGALAHWIRPVSQARRFVGAALPVHASPVDNLAPYAALRFARPGDVLVIQTDGCESASVLGDILVGMARNAGIVGVVTDGLARDVAGIDAVAIPVFARAVTPNSPFKDGPGTVGLTVTVGGVIVEPGDLLVGDADGVVVVPRARIESTAAALASIAAKEAQMDRAVANGACHPDWLDAVLDSDAVTWVE